MQLLELAFKGVRGFSPTVQVALQSGYNVLRPPGPGCPLASAIPAILYADGRGGESAYLAPGASAGAARLVIQGKDGGYRLTRQLGGPGVLERVAPDAARVTADAGEMLQFLRGQVGLPTRNVFEGLFTLTASQLPSRQKKKPKAGADKPGQPQLASAAVAPASDLAQAERRLQELEKERGLSQEVDQLQFKADGIASELFELESRVKGSDALEEAVRRAEKDVAAAPTGELFNLPKDIVARCQRYPAAVAKRDDALAKIAAERETAVEEAPSVPSLLQDPRFWAATVVGAGLLIGGALAHGTARYLALLDIPAFGFSALLGLHYVDALKEASKFKGKGGRLAEREKKVLELFEAEAAPVRAAMQALSVETPADVAEVLGKKAQLEQRLKEVRLELEAASADPEQRALSAKLTGLRAEQKRLNDELTEKGAYVRDVREVEREIARVRESIALASAPASAAQPATAATGELEDPFPALLGLGADFGATDVPTLLGQIRDRVGQYLQALTDRRLLGLDADKDGRGTAILASGRTPASQLAPADLDFAYLAVRLTLVERAAGAMPLVIDDLPEALPPAKQPLVGKMLKQLAGQTQVVHATAHPGFSQLAAAVVPI